MSAAYRVNISAVWAEVCILWMLTLRRCSSAEEKLNIPEGILKRIVKTQEQKEKDLEAVMHAENLPVINGIITTVLLYLTEFY